MAKRVLIVPKGHFGDGVLLTPVTEALKSSTAEISVSVLCPPGLVPLYSQDGCVDRVIPFDRRKTHRGFKGFLRLLQLIRAERFDRVYAFHRSPRTALVLWLSRIKERVGYSDGLLSWFYSRRVQRTAGAHEVIRSLELVYADLDSAGQGRVDALRTHPPTEASPYPFGRLRVGVVRDEQLSPAIAEFLAAPSPYILIAPGSAWETKQWRPEGFRAVAEQIVAQGTRVIVTGAAGDKAACAETVRGLDPSLARNVCAETNIADVVRLVQRAAVVVCNDSLALHLASAAQTPTVVVFCATSPRFGFGPWCNQAAIVEKRDLFCKPCRPHGSRRCPTGTRACMIGVSSAEVFSCVQRFMVQRGAWTPRVSGEGV